MMTRATWSGNRHSYTIIFAPRHRILRALSQCPALSASQLATSLAADQRRAAAVLRAYFLARPLLIWYLLSLLATAARVSWNLVSRNMTRKIETLGGATDTTRLSAITTDFAGRLAASIVIGNQGADSVHAWDGVSVMICNQSAQLLRVLYGPVSRFAAKVRSWFALVTVLLVALLVRVLAGRTGCAPGSLLVRGRVARACTGPTVEECSLSQISIGAHGLRSSASLRRTGAAP